MHKKRQYLWKRMVLIVAIVAGVLVLPFAVQAKKEQQSVDVLFTHDLHSHLDLFQAEVDGKLGEYGGVARIQTLIKEQRIQIRLSWMVETFPWERYFRRSLGSRLRS